MSTEKTTPALAAEVDAAIAALKGIPKTEDITKLLALLSAYRIAFRELLSYGAEKREALR